MGGALGGLANMAGDVPSPEAAKSAGEVEREAAEAAQAAAVAAQEIHDEVRVAEAQATGGTNPKGLPAPEPVSPASLVNDPAEPARAGDRQIRESLIRRSGGCHHRS
ncbi:hypothetical protein [Micromonospora sp. b486]|uniref:hypothetical protein n=1 Tax=Micromonospora sp. b486 TaxID=3053986 RepID=UPI00259C8595|nr:hypothetical protein [Micromonospora sp. b486]MDM4784550.1 hypothetical protein [Micromonospora sp. b486]